MAKADENNRDTRSFKDQSGSGGGYKKLKDDQPDKSVYDDQNTTPPKKKTPSGGGRGGPRASTGATGRSDSVVRTLLGQVRFPFDTRRYLEETIRLGQGADYYYARVLNSPEAKAYYIGMYRPDGTLRMTPQEYQQTADAYASTAAKYGFQLNRQQIGGLIAGNKSPQDFELDAQGIQLAKTNQAFVQSLNQHIQDRNVNLIKSGQKPIKKINNLQDAVNFFTGRAPQEVYDLYEGAQFASAAKEAGLVLSNKQARELAASTPGVLSYGDVQKGLQEAASELLSSGADLSEFGLSQEDVVGAQFGKLKAGMGQKLLQALTQAKARANAQQASSISEYGSGRPVTATRQEASL